MKNALRDLGERLVCLTVILILTTQVTAFLSRQIPGETLLRLHGITGELLYQYPLDELVQAYIFYDDAADTVSFAMTGGERLTRRQLSPLYQDVAYASVVRVSDLAPQRWLYARYDEVSTDDIYSTAQHFSRISNGSIRVNYLLRGITREPERLDGQAVLFRAELGDAVVFCLEAPKPDAVLRDAERCR